MRTPIKRISNIGHARTLILQTTDAGSTTFFKPTINTEKPKTGAEPNKGHLYWERHVMYDHKTSNESSQSEPYGSIKPIALKHNFCFDLKHVTDWWKDQNCLLRGIIETGNEMGAALSGYYKHWTFVLQSRDLSSMKRFYVNFAIPSSRTAQYIIASFRNWKPHRVWQTRSIVINYKRKDR